MSETVTNLVTTVSVEQTQPIIQSVGINFERIEAILAILIAASVGMGIMALIHDIRYPGGSVPLSRMSIMTGMLLGWALLGVTYFVVGDVFGEHTALVIPTIMFVIVNILSLMRSRLKYKEKKSIQRN